jgi:hypothetical protein
MSRVRDDAVVPCRLRAAWLLVAAMLSQACGETLLEPVAPEPPTQAVAALEAANWMRDHGERMLFIYGENDPWTAGAFSVWVRNDSYRFIVSGGTHGTRLRRLPLETRGHLQRRPGARTTDVPFRAGGPRAKPHPDV